MTLHAFAAIGPILYTTAWLLLGFSHDGYSHVGGSISVLAAYEAPYAWVMTAAFVLQAAAMAIAGWLLRFADRATFVILAINAIATVAVAAARIGCGSEDATWCTPSEHPLSTAVHIGVATIALVTLSLAPLVFGLRTRSSNRDGSRAALACFAVMVPLLVWFGIAETSGWAEKAVVTIGIFWAALAAVRQRS